VGPNKRTIIFQQPPPQAQLLARPTMRRPQSHQRSTTPRPRPAYTQSTGLLGAVGKRAGWSALARVVCVLTLLMALLLRMLVWLVLVLLLVMLTVVLLLVL
jgi:Flp pilus assembly protein TadB